MQPLRLWCPTLIEGLPCLIDSPHQAQIRLALQAPVSLTPATRVFILDTPYKTTVASHWGPEAPHLPWWGSSLS